MLIIVQYHELVTGLLDWSYNSLVPAFYAMVMHGKCDVVIYE
ncbi:FRG domain-containing protein [Staphylococcus epidermidis]|nr:FRG domain-containing protein [Staphylococcus epidermidis]MCR9005868.1 FRG domain-containing protein [Staphylococcus epidermidis]UYO28952.1 FRG domain-containing protein [Staphylococcus epidermidis]